MSENCQGSPTLGPGKYMNVYLEGSGVLGHTWLCSKFTTGSVLGDYFWIFGESWGSNKDQPCARQKPYFLSYLSSLLHISSSLRAHHISHSTSDSTGLKLESLGKMPGLQCSQKDGKRNESVRIQIDFM